MRKCNADSCSAEEAIYMNDDIITDEELMQKYGKHVDNEEMTFGNLTIEKIKSIRTCSGK